MIKLNFGCGTEILKDFENVDIQNAKGIDKSFDFNKFPYPLKKNKYDHILINNVLEHLLYPDRVLNELWKTAKRGGVVEIIVPHYTNKGAYNSLQHKYFFNENCFIGFSSNQNTHGKRKFELISIKLIPTKFGRLIPELIRKKLSLFINGLFSHIHVFLRVIK